jgi:hypothetical protein
VAKVYIVSFRTHDDRRPSKFIVLADNMKSPSRWLGDRIDFQLDQFLRELRKTIFLSLGVILSP